MSLGAFIQRWNGKYNNFDSAFGPQCVDIIKQYTHDIYGSGNWTTGNGCATGIYLNFPAALRPFFDKVANNPNDKNQIPPRGSIMVYGPTMGNKCGHVAIVVESNLKSHKIFEQNAFPIGSPCKFRDRNYIGVMGWLQPKGANMDEINALKADNANLRAQSATLANQVAQLTEQNKQLGITLQNVQKTNEEMQTIIKAKDQSLGEKVAQIADLSDKVTKLTNQLDEIKKPPQVGGGLLKMIVEFFKKWKQ